jgi:L-threonylcarbamoyladenylate synthase
VNSAQDAVAALRAGEPVVLPFDTVYGLAADPFTHAPVRKLYDLKGRVDTQPSALVAASVEGLLATLPDLPSDAEAIVRELLPGPYTLILPNPARRFRWLTGENPGAIGIRIPNLPSPTADVVAEVGAIVATSANHPGEEDPATLDEVPADIRAGAGAVVDGGRVPGTPSTVVDLSGAEPRILRRGAVSPEEVLRRLGAAVRSP